MTDPVQALARRLTPSETAPDHVLREVPAGQGVVDLLAVDFDDSVLERRIRAGIGPIVLPLRVEVLAHLRIDRFMSLETLAQRVASNPRALRRSTLLPLAESGAIELEQDRVRASGLWIPVARRLTAVELKLSKWRTAVRQADNAAWAADRSWVVLDAGQANGALRNRDYFAMFGLGLAVIDCDGRLRVIERPRRRRTISWLRSWLGELAWSRIVADAG